jgi:cytochrome c5
MNDAHDPAHDAPHEGPNKTPKQLITAVVASFIIPILVIVLLATYVDFGTKPSAGSDGLGAEAVARRLQPIGTIELRDINAPRLVRAGDAVYAGQCAACHTAGLAGAPKSGDVEAWAPRIKTGYEALLNSALKGKGAMGAQGGGEYDDIEIGRAVVYMANKSGGKFDVPQPPAAAAAASAAASVSDSAASVAN